MEFIFDNWVVVIFIIGAISSLIKKLKESNSEKSSQKQPNREKMKKFQQPVNESRSEVTRSNSNSIPTQKSQIEQEYYELKEINVDSTLKEKSTNDRKESQRKERVQKKVVNTDIEEQLDLSPRKENVIEGIVWAEILGPPRAFKSHSSRRATPKR